MRRGDGCVRMARVRPHVSVSVEVLETRAFAGFLSSPEGKGGCFVKAGRGCSLEIYIQAYIKRF